MSPSKPPQAPISSRTVSQGPSTMTAPGWCAATHSASVLRWWDGQISPHNRSRDIVPPISSSSAAAPAVAASRFGARRGDHTAPLLPSADERAKQPKRCEKARKGE